MLLERLQRQAGLTPGQLERYASTASKRYKVYSIKKRNGGDRIIAQPSKPIKALQRWIVRALLNRFEVHAAATAYKTGASIRANALRHAHTSFTVRVDFRDFFPSFTALNVQAFLERNGAASGVALSPADISFVTKIVSRDGALTIGAPSSPILTNVMMFEFDVALAGWCEARALIYTRYADDIFVSANGPNALGEVVAEIKRVAATHPFSNLTVNDEKTAFLSRKYRRTVTGLVIKPDGGVSIGLDRKRQLKSQLYAHRNGVLAVEDRSRIRGMLAFVQDVEPEFYRTLVRKYGAESISDL